MSGGRALTSSRAAASDASRIQTLLKGLYSVEVIGGRAAACLTA